MGPEACRVPSALQTQVWAPSLALGSQERVCCCPGGVGVHMLPGEGASAGALWRTQREGAMCAPGRADFSWLLCWAPGCCWWHCLQ